MKRRIIYTFVLSMIGLFGMSTICNADTGLNANEKELISYFEKGIEYEGKHYNIPSQYINQGINYLKQSKVDITEEQKRKVYQTVVDMTVEGIKQGYLVLEGTTTPSKDGSESKQDEKDGESSTEVGKTEASTENKATSPVKQADQGGIHIDKDKLNVPQMIETAKELSMDLGVKVSFDAEKLNVNVVNEEGKVVMLAGNTIKNTGYRLNQTIILSIGLLLLFGASIMAASKYQLFAHEDET